MNNYIIFDFETTGLNVINDKPVEVAGIKINNGKIIGKFSEVLKCDVPVSEDALALHKLTDKFLLKNGKEPKEVYKEFLNFVEDYPILAHNGNGFDFPLLKVALYENELPIPSNILIDTLYLSRNFNKGISSHSGDSLGKLYGVKNENAHRALPDCMALFEIFKNLLKIEDNLESLHKISGFHRMDTISFNSGYMDKIVDAIDSKKDLFIKYEKKQGETNERWISPISFEANRGTIQLNTYCYLRKEERKFNLNGILEISKTRKTK